MCDSSWWSVEYVTNASMLNCLKMSWRGSDVVDEPLKKKEKLWYSKLVYPAFITILTLKKIVVILKNSKGAYRQPANGLIIILIF